MPLYEYQCKHCGRFEVLSKFSDPPLKACPTCKRSVQKLPSAPAIQFKGTGWYVTDYAKKTGGSDGSNSSKSESGKTESGKSESGKSESGKSESGKSESKKGETSRSKSKGDSKASE